MSTTKQGEWIIDWAEVDRIIAEYHWRRKAREEGERRRATREAIERIPETPR